MLIRADKNHGVIDSPISVAAGQLLNGCPGRRKWKLGNFYFELSAANLEYLDLHFPSAEWGESILPYLTKVKALRIEERTLQETKHAPIAPDMEFEYKTTPRAHQERCFIISRDKVAFGIFAEMGCGKTKIVLDTAAYLYSKGEIDCMIVFAPNGVHRNWVSNEIPAHLPDWTKAKAVYWSSSKAKQKRLFNESLTYREGLLILAYNIEYLSLGAKALEGLTTILRERKVLLVIDESTRIKSPSSNRSLSAIKLAPLARYRRIMSGAPVTNGLENLFMQFKFLDPDILGFSSFYTFRNRYCIVRQVSRDNPHAVEIVGYQNIEEFQKRIDGHSFRVEKKDCLDLPPKIYLEREVPMTDDQRKMYDTLREDLMVDLGNGTVVDGNSAITRILKLQQILCGFIIDENKNRLPVPSRRMDAVEEILDEIGDRKVIIWSRFIYNIEQLIEMCRKKGIGAVAYYGAVKDDAREEAVNSFQNDPACQVFIGQQRSGGIGLTLTAATTVVYFSNTFDAEERWQSEDRAHRIGQTASVTYIDLVCSGTVDKKIARALKEKKDIAAMAFALGKGGGLFELLGEE